MYEVIFDRNGAKAYVKIYEFFLREKSAKRGFMKFSSHSSTASGSFFDRTTTPATLFKA
jgi:hypothetical protein